MYNSVNAVLGKKQVGTDTLVILHSLGNTVTQLHVVIAKQQLYFCSMLPRVFDNFKNISTDSTPSFLL